MILWIVIIILVFVLDNQRESYLCNDKSSEVAVKFLWLVSSKYPLQSLSKKNVSSTQLLYNSCSQSVIKFKSLTSERIYNSMRYLTFGLKSLLNEKVSSILFILSIFIIILGIYKYWQLKNVENIVITLRKEIKIQHKVIARLDSCLAQQNEKITRHYIGEMKDFGIDFAQGVKIISLQQAVQHVFERRGEIFKDDDIITECSKIRDTLRPSDGVNNSEFVTGIQKDILIWYLEGVRRYRLKSPSELEDKLRRFSWVGEDGKLSLVNVRKCIRFVHKDLKQTLAFLAQTIDWDDLNSFISLKGKAKGHGLYLLMHHLYTSHCKATSATVHNPHIHFPFPPPGEIEIDVQGRIETGVGLIKIKIGGIIISQKQIPKVRKQLYRSLVFFAGLHKLMAGNDDVSPICYDLTGYIFISGGRNFTKNEVLPLPPLGKISYVTFNS